MDKIKFKNDFTLGELKYGDNVWNGIYNGMTVTVVKEKRNVIEKKLQHPNNVLGLIATYLDDDQNVYNLYNAYACNLEQFISLKNGTLKIEDLKCSEEDKVVLENSILVKEDGRHTPLPVNILRDTLNGCTELRGEHLCHGDLTPKNIVLCIVRGKIIAKVTGVKPEADHLLTDYQSLGNLIIDLFSSTDRYGVKRISHEARDLWMNVTKMIPPNFIVGKGDWMIRLESAETAFNRNPNSLLTHPIFWTDENSLNFILKLRQVIGKCNTQAFSGAGYTEVKDFMRRINEIERSNWFDQFKKDSKVRLRLDKKNNPKIKNPYNVKKTEDLLRFMRDMHSHIEEQPPECQLELKDLPSGFFEFFRGQYPELLLSTRRVVACYFPDIKETVGIFQDFKGYIFPDIKDEVAQ
ncbi:hypothetical protein MKW92_023615 [Papaver armeniacum]|nr:hypothetical protein MKW92_023615 [Papaver armeniacum]